MQLDSRRITKAARQNKLTMMLINYTMMYAGFGTDRKHYFEVYRSCASLDKRMRSLDSERMQSDQVDATVSSETNLQVGKESFCLYQMRILSMIG